MELNAFDLSGSEVKTKVIACRIALSALVFFVGCSIHIVKGYPVYRADTPLLSEVWVPGGSFQRDGSTENLSTVGPFMMSSKEITWEELASVFNDVPSSALLDSEKNDPTEQINWYHAIAFCNKLSLLEGLNPIYTVSEVDFATLSFIDVPTINDASWNQVSSNWNNNGYRLPTEMEWMWAAMGADPTNHVNSLAGSHLDSAEGVYASPSTTGITLTDETNFADIEEPNKLGIYGMFNNVDEWTWDLFASYPSGSLTDYRGPSLGTDRVARGGYLYSQTPQCTEANRYASFPNSTDMGRSFRVVRR